FNGLGRARGGLGGNGDGRRTGVPAAALRVTTHIDRDDRFLLLHRLDHEYGGDRVVGVPLHGAGHVEQRAGFGVLVGVDGLPFDAEGTADGAIVILSHHGARQLRFHSRGGDRGGVLEAADLL